MTYQPLATVDDIDLTADDAFNQISLRIAELGATHVRDTRHNVWKMRAWMNKKSVPLDHSTNAPTRLPFKQIESLGIVEPDQEPVQAAPAGEENAVDEVIDDLKEQIPGFSISISRAPGTSSDGDSVTDIIEAAAARAGVLDTANSLPDDGQRPHHTERAHALLSASSSHRWLNCPPSAVLADKHPQPADSPAAAEGTAAHELAEHKLRKALKLRSDYPASDLIDEDMQEHTDGYVTFVLEQYKAAKERTPDAQILVEQRLDFSDIVPDGFGTGDALIIDDTTLHIIDLKYGQGILVDAENNPQMKLYALGALNLLGYLYDVDEVAMTIYQPRRDNISTWRCSVDDLHTWAAETVAPVAKLAAAGEGDFTAGDWCGFCPVKATCRARADKNLELAQHEFRPPAELSDAEIADVLTRLPEVKKWAADVEKYANAAAIDHGKKFPGFKLVEGRSVRKFADPQAVATAAIDAGYPDVYEKKLLGITAMEKYLTKPVFADVLGGLVIKPAGKPTLVPVSDRRPEIQGHSAQDDFGGTAA